MVVFIALSNIQHVFIDIEFLSEASIIRKLYLPIQWLILPMFYLHVHEFSFKKKISFSTLLYLFTPVVFVFVLHIVHFLFNYGSMLISDMPDYYSQGLLLYINFISFLFNGVLLFLIYNILRNNLALNKKVARKKYNEQKWYLTIIALITVIVTVGLLASVSIIQFNIDHTALLYSLFLFVSFVGYYTGYFGVYRSTLRAEYKTSINSVLKNGANTYHKIHTHIIEERRYLDVDLNQSEIVQKFNISPDYLSQLITTNSDKNFNDFINSMRIDASKKMLTENQFENYTIESIGFKCGFKSKSNFYTAFKKFTGQTPKEYLKNQKIRLVS